ncbi:MAG: helix-turn-helix domain-containing protein [Planctomycetota bacterium]|jgi:DNA-binding IclR family transcriptional regulator
MIQVLQRTIEIMELFIDKPFLSFGEIHKQLSFQKTTLSNILKSLLEAGFLRKTGQGEYSIGSRWTEMLVSLEQHDPVVEAAKKTAHDITKKTGNGVSILRLKDGTMQRVVKSFYSDSGFVIQTQHYLHSIINNISACTLLAHLPKSEAEELMSDLQFPLPKYPQYETRKKFNLFLNKIKKQGWAKINYSLDEMSAFAMPVLNEDNYPLCVVGIFLPRVRCQGRDKDVILKQLKKAVTDMEEMLTTEV